MSNYPYINPTSKSQLSVPYSVPQGYTNGTHFSIYGVGGYMEVHNLSDLYLSAGTIPINVQYDLSGNVSTLILNNDNVSSGRRKLGMLAYVYETDSIYQFYIPNYDTAFNTATGSSSYQKRYTIFGTYETYVYPNSATTLLINGWTGNTIEGVNGATSSTASWRKLSFSGGSSSGGTLSGDYLPLSGGTVTGNTKFTLGLTATTISATTYLNVPSSIFSGGTVTGPTNFTNGLTANTISATTYLNLPSFTGGTGSTLQYFITGSTPGGTIYDGDRWFNTTTGAELVYIDDGNSSQWVEPNPGNIFDTYVTGGTYSNGVAVFTNNSGSTFSVTGFTTPFTGNTSATCINSIYVTNVYGCSPINFKDLIIAESGLTTSILTATTITNTYLNTSYVRDSSGTVAIDTANRQLKKSDGSTIILDWENGILSGMTSIRANSISASTYQNLTTSLNGIYLPLSGGTVTGSTIFTNGLTANTISATTYQNLPTDITITGATYSNNTFTYRNNTGGTFSVLFNTVTGLTVNGSLNITGTTTSGTISATTYQNLPTDVRTTGATYSNNTFTFTNNTGGTYSVLFNTVTGITVNGNLTITVNTSAQGLTATTISATTYQNIPSQSGTGVSSISYTQSTGLFSLITNEGRTLSTGTFSYLTGATYTNNNFTFTSNLGVTSNVNFNTFTGLTVNGNLSVTGTTTSGTISATTYQNLPTDIRTTGSTYSNNNFTFTNNTGGTYSVLFNTVTGLTVNGNLSVTGTTSSGTISATTYQNLPSQSGSGVSTLSYTTTTGILTLTKNDSTTLTAGTFTYLTGASYSNNNITLTNNLGTSSTVSINTLTGLTINGNLTITGNTSAQGLTATTISATTYQNLPTDVRVTGATYSNNTFTYTNNTGGTFSVLFNTVTGLTATTISATTYQNIPIKYYAEFSGAPTNSPIVLSTGSISIGDGAESRSTYMLAFGQNSGRNATGTTYSNFIGVNAGYDASGSSYSNFIGSGAGYGAINTSQSNFIGNSSGFGSTGVTQSFFVGYETGRQSVNLNYSNVFGYQAGYGVTSATYVNFFGNQAGYQATSAQFSNFIGYAAGTSATNAQYSNFIGANAGLQASNASYSTLIGFNAGKFFTSNNIGSNNIIIGTNISLPSGTTNSLNIGGVLFGTGLYSTTGGNPLITSNGGKIGINIVNPTNTLDVGGGLLVTGTTFLGNGTFTKAGNATGDILLDNSSTDTPGVLFYYANNSNYGVDSWNGTYDVLSGQLLRFTNKLNESGGAVKMAIDTSGNLAVGGFVKANAWRAGQVVNDIMLSNTEVTISTTTIATSTSDTDFLTYSYTPLSSTSYLVIHYHLASFSFEGGTGNDSYFSRIKVDGAEITYSRQSTVNGNRTGVLFPLTGRYTNSNTTAKSIVVACRRDSADDSITIVNSSSSMWLRITEIAR